MKHTNEAFADKSIDVDDQSFEGCKFSRCTIAYSGGKPPTFINCKFDASDFAFYGAASNTVRLMQAMYHGGFKPVIEITLDNIRTNSPLDARFLH